ncbi:hypothetical protein CD30_05945 [Ureibacillus massiliensis 4400831 = CIP 108448 = CCUG 49529]|uniref:Uncharacterized protein n=1 Tax=Ureibacillus massiliensis 4400831 = CIP 108448 = CCUG 49529 TaxID=1211035 RepID=A0A0A3JWJ0_9BACL|nr:hypothetical protein [Ureibacillus massiliensis]KGR91357.1 hypothetical protein CD30_05945 [Ureibacillus massiliensis 4400831 = CIP 108448 = CCUG 49529]
MKEFEQLTNNYEMVQALKEKSIHYNCIITGFEVHKDSHLNITGNDVWVSWWDYRGRQKRVDIILSCSNEREQERVYIRWWQSIEIVGGKSRKDREEEQEEIDKRNREFEEKNENVEIEKWMKALGF